MSGRAVLAGVGGGGCVRPGACGVTRLALARMELHQIFMRAYAHYTDNLSSHTQLSSLRRRALPKKGVKSRAQTHTHTHTVFELMLIIIIRQPHQRHHIICTVNELRTLRVVACACGPTKRPARNLRATAIRREAGPYVNMPGVWVIYLNAPH